MILACGGFEWNRTLVDRFLGVPMVAPGSPPFNEGDGLAMSMEVGAALANMSDVYWGVMVSIPGDEYEGEQLHRTTTDVRGPAGSIIVNRHGRRFANEAMNYNDFGKVMAQFDPMTYEYSNLPCHLVFDARFRLEHTVMTVQPGDPTPPWLHESTTLRELADRIGVDADGLDTQVAEFNHHAEHGVDPVFHRGENAYDRMRGSDHGGANPNVRPLGDGPYYALELQLGCLGTKGGPLINEHAQVLDVRDLPIEGLYVCGNTAVSVLGAGYASTLGPILTMGYLAGRHVASPCGCPGARRSYRMSGSADLADRLALRDLVEGYARCADRCDGPGLAALFELDGELRVRRPQELAPSTVLRGRDEIAIAIGRLSRYDATFHLVANQYVTLAGAEATAEVYCLAHHVSSDPDGEHEHGRDHVMVIRYADRYRRNPDGWRFVERELHVDWTEDRAITAPPLPRQRPPAAREGS